MDNQRASSSYTQTSPTCWEYDVFLSFRGEDTRNTFTSHLHAGLTGAGIDVFIDDEGLGKGTCIGPELVQAIKKSRFLVIVFSKNYASSTWCLDELAEIAECINTGGQIVIPIFYDVDPSVVRKQMGEFQKDLIRHEERFPNNSEKVQKWREALTKVAGIAGYVLGNRSEADFVQKIVKEISTKLSLFLTSKNLIGLVGLGSPVEELKRLIAEGSQDDWMIGIRGMTGIGKTTIARVIYDLISLEFEGSSFLENVSQNSIISLQKQLLYQTLDRKKIKIFDISGGIVEIKKRLCNKMVLVVIDDVTHVNQLDNLAGARDWFGPGSKIIVTTRDTSILFGERQVYEAKLLNDDDAFQLFSLNAFKKSEPSEECVELSKSIVKYCFGLPVALQVLGSFFRGRTNVDEWRRATKKLSKVPKEEIINKLKISFEGLESSEQEIFLDIACFFKGESVDHVTNILDACGFPAFGITTLIERHLITICGSNKLWMHDLLQQMGREIVKRKSSEPGGCSRLWEKEDICRVFRDNTGTEAIEGIMVEEDLNLDVSAKAFSKMRRLRLLKIKNLKILGGTLNRLSNNLRFLEWHGKSFKSLPSSVELDKVVDIKLHHNKIKSLWKGSKQLSMLRSINLKNCHKLKGVLDLTGAPNLWKLRIKGCPKLHKILLPLQVHEEFDPSKQLRSISLKDCHNLEEISDLLHAPNLSDLCIKGCPKLRTIVPHLQGHTKIVPWKPLTSLILGSCQQLMEIPDLKYFPNLLKLHISNCPRLGRIDSPFLVHKNLKYIFVHGCDRLETFPDKIHMESLERFVINSCRKLKNLPEIAGSMNRLWDLHISQTAIRDMPLSYGFLPALKSLSLFNNDKLVTLPSTFSGLTSFSLFKCTKLENFLETLGQVESLCRLDLRITGITQLPSSIFSLENLKELICFDLVQGSADAMALMLPSLSGSTCSLRTLVL